MDDTPPLGLPLPLTGATRLYAIVGDPIEQAGSPGLFNQAFRGHNAPAVLVPMQVPPGSLSDLVTLFRATGNWDGLVVTVPHKVAISALLDELGSNARRTGAVNAIRKAVDGRLIGDNFDGIGFLRGLANQGHAVKGRRVLLVGAGGAGRAIAHALADGGAAALTLFDRDEMRSSTLAAAVRTENPAMSVTCGAPTAKSHDVVVNCAPPDGDRLSVDLADAAAGTLVVDIVLKPSWTPLLARAQERGLATHAGIHMLSGQVQAVLSFFGLKHLGDAAEGAQTNGW